MFATDAVSRRQLAKHHEIQVPELFLSCISADSNTMVALKEAMRVPVVLAAVIAAAWPQVHAETCDVCTVRNAHSKDFSTPFEAGKDYSTCKYYKDAACCSHETVQECAFSDTQYCHCSVPRYLGCVIRLFLYLSFDNTQ